MKIDRIHHVAYRCKDAKAHGHRLDLACPDPGEDAMNKRLDEVKWDMLEEWSKTKRAPRHGAFLHQREFKQ